MLTALPMRRLRSVAAMIAGSVPAPITIACAIMTLATPIMAQQVVVPQGRTPAQNAAAGLGKNVSNTDIANAIKSSGLSPAEVRAKLQQAGFDPKLADPFFGSGASTVSPAPSSTIDALTSIGLLSAGVTTELTPGEAPKQKLDSMQTDTMPEKPMGISKVFGRDIFSSKANAFEPDVTGPVDPNYRLGIGDNVQVVLTGQVEEAYQTEVRPDGKILLPLMGFTSVAGLTLDGARGALKASGARVYSGLRNGGTKLDLTVTKVRTNQVFVIGDVERPGSYMVSGLSTAFHAIARAGGPSEHGSFRDIELRRGSTVRKRIDLYDYLIRGDASVDMNTEQGDVIFVPPAKSIVQIHGAVRRDGIFELRDGERFKDLIFFAGGLLPTAATNRIQIDRILPADARRAGVDRVMLDIPVGEHAGALDTLSLLDGDSVNVFEIGDLRRNTVKVSGAVFQPGTYQWRSGLTLGELVARANGLLPWGVSDRVKLTRNILSNGHVEIMSVNLADSTGAGTVLKEFDEVFVLDQRDARQVDSVSIAGSVRKPGTRAWAENLTLRDLVDLSNGFEPWAISENVIVKRADLATGKPSIFKVDMRDTSAARFLLLPRDSVMVPDARIGNPARKISVTGAVFLPGDQSYGAGVTLGNAITVAGGLRNEAEFIDVSRRVFSMSYTDSSAVARRFTITRAAADTAWRSFALEPEDHIAVRLAPGFKQPGAVTLVGAFLYPGSYVITSDKERVSSLLARAGGIAPNAYVRSFRMVRNGRPVPVDLDRIRRKIETDDIELSDGDQLMIEANSDVVTIGGAVERPASVPYRPDWDVDDYINAAGGFTTKANTKSIVVSYASGAVKRKKGGWFGIGGSLPMEPGATVTVGSLDASDQQDFGKTITTIMQVTTTLVSLLVAFIAIKKS